MSVKISHRVWEHSKHSGSALVVMLALADFANDDGVAWPGMTLLASKARLGVRPTEKIVAKLIRSGELYRVVGGGRGKPTYYGVASGMNEHDLDRLGRALQMVAGENPVRVDGVSRKNPVQENTVSLDNNPVLRDGVVVRNPVLGNGDQENGVFLEQKPRPAGRKTPSLQQVSQSTSEASGGVSVVSAHRNNHHDPSLDPSYRERVDVFAASSGEMGADAPSPPAPAQAQLLDVPAEPTLAAVEDREKRKRRAPDPNRSHPSVKLVNAQLPTSSPLNAVASASVVAAVGDDPVAQERFRLAFEAWLEAGYKPSNMNGVLDWMEKGKVPRAKRGINGASGSGDDAGRSAVAGSNGAPIRSAEEGRRILREQRERNMRILSGGGK